MTIEADRLTNFFGDTAEAADDITTEAIAQSPRAYEGLPTKDATYSGGNDGFIKQISPEELAEGLTTTGLDRAKHYVLAGLPVAAIGSAVAGAYILSQNIGQ